MVITLCLYASRTGSSSGQHPGVSPCLPRCSSALCAFCCTAQLPANRHTMMHHTPVGTILWSVKQPKGCQMSQHQLGSLCEPFPDQTMANPPCCIFNASPLKSTPQSFPVEPLDKAIKVVGCGSCGVDYLASVAAFPHPDQKLRTDALEVSTLIRRSAIHSCSYVYI